MNQPITRRPSSKLIPLIALFALAVIVDDDDHQGVFQYATKDNVTFKVEKSERVNRSNEDSRYMVWTVKADGEEEVFENTDAFWQWKFNSADLHDDYKPGHCYNAEVTGWRVAWFSANRNIVTLQETVCEGALANPAPAPQQ